MNSDLKSFMRLVVYCGTQQGTKFCKAISVLKGICISQRSSKSVGGLKTNFNFEVKQKFNLSITTFTSLENETNLLKNRIEKNLRIQKKQLHSNVRLELSAGKIDETRNGEIFLFNHILKLKMRTTDIVSSSPQDEAQGNSNMFYLPQEPCSFWLASNKTFGTLQSTTKLSKRLRCYIFVARKSPSLSVTCVHQKNFIACKNTVSDVKRTVFSSLWIAFRSNML